MSHCEVQLQLQPDKRSEENKNLLVSRLYDFLVTMESMSPLFLGVTWGDDDRLVVLLNTALSDQDLTAKGAPKNFFDVEVRYSAVSLQEPIEGLVRALVR